MNDSTKDIFNKTPNYFEFYQLPIQFVIDANALKKQFYQLSRKYHPDFHVQASAAEQDKMLELSSLNTQAYKTLANADSRMKHVLTLKGYLVEGERYQLPPSFLMEMMDINENLMDLEMEGTGEEGASAALRQTKTQVQAINEALEQEIQPILTNYKDEIADDSAEKQLSLKKVKEYYYKKRYLLRISKSLDKFAL